MRLRGKVAIITGAASRGMGRAIANRFAKEGADIVIADIASADSTINEIKTHGGKALVIKTDVTRSSEVDSMVEAVLHRFGKIDILVNNAGILLKKPFIDTTEEEWERVFNINVKGYFLCARAVAKEMIKKRKGKILMVASDSAIVGFANLVAYGSSKGAVLSFVRCLAAELAPYGVNVNAILPGTTETDMSRKNLADPAWRKQVVARFPLGRLGKPEDTAGAALYLASSDSDWMTGQGLVVDGGHTMV